MKAIKYKEGDVFYITLDTNKYAICKIIFAPKGKFKQIISCVVLSIQPNLNLEGIDFNKSLKIKSNPNNPDFFFTGNQFIKSGVWPIISYSNLTTEEEKMQWFLYAGQLYHKEEFIETIGNNPSEYKTMQVAGFELVKNLLNAL